MSAAVLGPGAPSFISSQPTAAAAAIAPRTATNPTQSGVHKYSLKGHETVWGGGGGRGGRLLIQPLHSQLHPCLIYKSPLSHMDKVIDSVI